MLLFLSLCTSAFQLPGLKASTCFCRQPELQTVCVCFLWYQGCGALLLDRPNWVTSQGGHPLDHSSIWPCHWGMLEGRSAERLEEEDVSQESCNPVAARVLCAKLSNASSARFSPSVNIVCHCLASFQVTLEVLILGHGFYKQLCLSKTIIPNWGLPFPYQKALSPQLCQERGTQALPYLLQAREKNCLPHLYNLTQLPCSGTLTESCLLAGVITSSN